MSPDRQTDADPDASGADRFDRLAQAAGKRRSGPVAEFWYFLGRTRKWWMLPILLMLLLVGTLVVMAGTSVGPLIYALF